MQLMIIQLKVKLYRKWKIEITWQCYIRERKIKRDIEGKRDRKGERDIEGKRESWERETERVFIEKLRKL